VFSDRAGLRHDLLEKHGWHFLPFLAR
jgi:hypothetical protein